MLVKDPLIKTPPIVLISALLSSKLFENKMLFIFNEHYYDYMNLPLTYYVTASEMFNEEEVASNIF